FARAAAAGSRRQDTNTNRLAVFTLDPSPSSSRFPCPRTVGDNGRILLWVAIFILARPAKKLEPRRHGDTEQDFNKRRLRVSVSPWFKPLPHVGTVRCCCLAAPAAGRRGSGGSGGNRGQGAPCRRRRWT